MFLLLTLCGRCNFCAQNKKLQAISPACLWAGRTCVQFACTGYSATVQASESMCLLNDKRFAQCGGRKVPLADGGQAHRDTNLDAFLLRAPCAAKQAFRVPVALEQPANKTHSLANFFPLPSSHFVALSRLRNLRIASRQSRPFLRAKTNRLK